MHKEYIKYLGVIADVMQAHAQTLDTFAKVLELGGDDYGFDTQKELEGLAGVIKAHSQEIQEVADNPHLLLNQ